MKGHEIQKEKQNKNKDKSAVNSMVDSFTENLTGKKEGAKAAVEVTKKTSNNTYIESTQVLLGKEDWLFYKATDDGDPIADYQGINHYDEDTMKAMADKLVNEMNQFKNYGCDLYLLSIPNKASVYPEYMPDTIQQENTTSRTDQFIQYLKANTHFELLWTTKPGIKKG